MNSVGDGERNVNSGNSPRKNFTRNLHGYGKRESSHTRYLPSILFQSFASKAFNLKFVLNSEYLQIPETSTSSLKKCKWKWGTI